MKIHRFISKFLQLDIIKTILFNLYYFPIKEAIKFPILVSRRTIIVKLGGKLRINGEVYLGRIKIGFLGLGTLDSRYTRTKWEMDGDIVVNGEMGIGRGCNICVYGDLVLDGNFTMTGGSTIICKKKIKFGNNVLISWDCLFMDSDFHEIIDLDSQERVNGDMEILIGNNVWFGCRAMVLKGSIIPDNNVIASGVVVSKQLNCNNSIIGNVGKVLKSNIMWRE